MTDQHKKPYEPRRFSEPEFEEKTKEKYEKEDEKQEEKHNQDPLSSLVWALILIWAGLVFLASNLGWLDQIRAEPITIGDVTITSLSRWSLIVVPDLPGRRRIGLPRSDRSHLCARLSFFHRREFFPGSYLHRDWSGNDHRLGDCVAFCADCNGAVSAGISLDPTSLKLF